MCSLKLEAQTLWPRAQVSLPQPQAAHQPAPHWAGALKVEATKHPSSQQEVMGLTHSGQKSQRSQKKKERQVTSPNSQQRSLLIPEQVPVKFQRTLPIAKK